MQLTHNGACSYLRVWSLDGPTTQDASDGQLRYGSSIEVTYFLADQLDSIGNRRESAVVMVVAAKKHKHRQKQSLGIPYCRKEVGSSNILLLATRSLPTISFSDTPSSAASLFPRFAQI